MLVSCFVLAVVLSLALNPLYRRLALRVGFVEQPTADRWHERPTPPVGGAAIATTLLIAVALLEPLRDMWLLVLCVGFIFTIGSIDDIRPLRPSTKLIGQIIIASVLLFFGYRLGWSESLTLDTMLTLLWIVGITNAFNLLDNMDGLCAGVALIAGSALLALFVSAYGSSAEAVYLAVLLGASVGFLVYNFHPARVFLGDSGSMLLGLSMAVLALGRGNGLGLAPDMVSAIAAPALVLLIPIFDTTLVTVSRMRAGRSPAQGGTDHSSHRLVAIGLSEPTAVAVLWTLAVIGALLGVTVQRLDGNETVVVVSVFLIAVVMFALYLGRARVYEHADPALVRAGKMTLLFNDFPYKRRVVQILWDLGLVSVAYYSAYRLRFDSEAFRTFFPSFIQSLPLVLGVQMLTLAAAGGYSRVRRGEGDRNLVGN